MNFLKVLCFFLVSWLRPAPAVVPAEQDGIGVCPYLCTPFLALGGVPSGSILLNDLFYVGAALLG